MSLLERSESEIHDYFGTSAHDRATVPPSASSPGVSTRTALASLGAAMHGGDAAPRFREPSHADLSWLEEEDTQPMAVVPTWVPPSAA